MDKRVYRGPTWTGLDELYYYIPGLLDPGLDLDPSHANSKYDTLLQYQEQIRRFVGHPAPGYLPPPPHPQSQSVNGQLSEVASLCLQFRRDVNSSAIAIIREMRAAFRLQRSAECVRRNFHIVQAAVVYMRELKLSVFAAARQFRLVLLCEPLRRAIECATPYMADSFALLEHVLTLVELSNPVLVPVLDSRLIESYAVRNWYPSAINPEFFNKRGHGHPIVRILAARFGIWVRTYLLRILVRYTQSIERGISPEEHPLTPAEVHEKVSRKILMLEEQRYTLYEVQRRLIGEKDMSEPTALQWTQQLLQMLSAAFKQCLQIDQNLDCFLVGDLDRI